MLAERIENANNFCKFLHDKIEGSHLRCSSSAALLQENLLDAMALQMTTLQQQIQERLEKQMNTMQEKMTAEFDKRLDTLQKQLENETALRLSLERRLNDAERSLKQTTEVTQTSRLLTERKQTRRQEKQAAFQNNNHVPISSPLINVSDTDEVDRQPVVVRVRRDFITEVADSDEAETEEEEDAPRNWDSLPVGKRGRRVQKSKLGCS